jgi:hypothetical protein
LGCISGDIYTLITSRLILGTLILGTLILGTLILGNWILGTWILGNWILGNWILGNWITICDSSIIVSRSNPWPHDSSGSWSIIYHSCP